MKYFSYLGTFLLILSLIFSCDSMTYQLSDDEKIVDQITIETAKKLEQEKNLVLIGTGGRMMYEIEMLAMSFQLFHEVDLKEARELVVYAIKEYLSNINSNEEVRPYLHNYPFTAKNVQIMIWIYKPDRTDPALDKIYHISSINGIINYYLDLPETYSRKSICTETYEEAVQKITSTKEPGKTGQTKNNQRNEMPPFLEVVAKDGAKIKVSAVSLEDSMFELSGEGFKPCESLNFMSHSCGETICIPIQADKSGSIPTMGHTTAVVGKPGGICHIDILRDESPIQIKLPWGAEALKIDNMNNQDERLERSP